MSEGKSAKAYRTISEVAESLGVPQHVLRFWETKFPAVKPLKRGGNRRYYRPEDIELLQVIHRLLHVEGYTIKGAQKLMKERGARALVEALLNGAGTAAQPVPLALAAAAAAIATPDTPEDDADTDTPEAAPAPEDKPATTAPAQMAAVPPESARPAATHLNGGAPDHDHPAASTTAAWDAAPEHQRRAAVVEELRAIRARLAAALG